MGDCKIWLQIPALSTNISLKNDVWLPSRVKAYVPTPFESGLAYDLLWPIKFSRNNSITSKASPWGFHLCPPGILSWGHHVRKLVWTTEEERPSGGEVRSPNLTSSTSCRHSSEDIPDILAPAGLQLIPAMKSEYRQNQKDFPDKS